MNNITIIATLYSSSTKTVQRSDSNGVIQLCEASLFVDFQKGEETQTGWLLAEAWGTVSEQLNSVESGQPILVSGTVEEFQVSTPGGAISRYPKITVRNVVRLLGGADKLFSSIHVDGRLVSDPEYRSLSDGSLVANCRIAADNFRDKNCPYFYNLENWARTAAVLVTNCYKGKQISVEGSLKFNNYTSPTTGEACTNFRIRVNSLKLGLDTQQVRQEKFNNQSSNGYIAPAPTLTYESGVRQSPFDQSAVAESNQNNDLAAHPTAPQTIHNNEPSLDDVPF